MYQLTAPGDPRLQPVMLHREDGAIIGIPADPANTDYQAYLAWLAEGNTPEPAPPLAPEPDWVGFIVEFNLPGNFLYNATATKVQASGEVTKEHWFNLKLGLNISEIRSIEWLQLSYNYLLYLLEVNNQALTIEEKQAWLDMANKHNITIE